jgi:uncharacterized protein (TIGR03435 family)
LGSTRLLLMTALALRSTAIGAQPVTRFDAASVKVVEYAGPVEMKSDAGRIDYRHIGIKALVWLAFPLTEFQIIWPRQIAGNAKFYDVSATFPPHTTKDQLYLMLQGLLADRFKLASHWETRDIPVFALKISKRGLKVHKSDNPPGDDVLSISVSLGPDGWRLSDHLPNASPTAPSGITVSKLTQYLNNNYIFDRMLLDQTGLTGYYNINMFITPDAAGIGNSPDTGARTPVMPDAEGFVNALETQLGLTLEKQAAPVRVLVIDHLETVPAEN